MAEVVTAVILCAGRGSRFGTDKILESLDGKPVWKHSFDTFLAHTQVTNVGIVTSEANLSQIESEAPEALFVIEGGESRQESALKGVQAAAEGIVLLHDGARPWISAEVITRVIEAVSANEAAAAAVPVTDTLRQNGQLVNRNEFVAMQTPQAATRATFLSAYSSTASEFTDEVAVLQAAGVPVTFVEGDPANRKITYLPDLKMNNFPEFRTGIGYDTHTFSQDKGRALWLGGVEFPFEPALEGHSDADALLHAIVDALLGAAALGDIGVHFPNTDPKWHNAPSIEFLIFAKTILFEAGWRIVNVDATVIAEFPKVMRRASEIREVIATALGVSTNAVSVKATTNEKMGAIGRGEGIAAFATAMIVRRQ